MKVLTRIGAIAALLALSSPLPTLALSRDAPRQVPQLHVPDFNVPAAQLRVALDTTLAEHAFLLGEAMRVGLQGGADFEAVGAALEENTSELVDMIVSVYGADAGDAFGDLWRSHIAFLIDYTRALADDDQDAKQLAANQLQTYVTDFSALLAGANPNLPEAAVNDLISEHVAQLKSIAVYATTDYSQAYPLLHDIYFHMFDIGDALANGIALQFPEKFTGRSLAFSPAGDLRVALDRLLGEHTALAVTAMRADVTGSEDEPAAKDALDSNTDAIAAWVADVYGAAAGDAFKQLWTEHTSAYLAYVSSLKADDASGQTAALDRLKTYQLDFSRFLANANPNVSAADFREMLEHHTNQLIAQADAYADADYTQAYGLARAAFKHAVEMGDVLALAIAAQFPDKFPDTATADPAPIGLASFGWLLILTAALLAVGSRARRVMVRRGTQLT